MQREFRVDFDKSFKIKTPKLKPKKHKKSSRFYREDYLQSELDKLKFLF